MQDLDVAIAVAGGGPSGLYFAILMRRLRPDWEVTVFERNAPTDAFGFGVVFSDETLTVFEHADPESYAEIVSRFVRWTDIDIHHRGARTRSGGHGFSALGRRELLALLQDRAAALGADLRFGDEVALDDLGWADLVVAADGANSRVRAAAGFDPALEPALLPVHVVRDRALSMTRSSSSSPRPSTASFRPTPIPTASGVSTFIVETHVDVWRAAGLRRRRRARRPGSATSARSRSARSCSPTRWRAGRCWPTTPSGSTSSPCGSRAGRRATSCSSATPPTRRTSRSARGPSWPWRTRPRWPGPWVESRRMSRRPWAPTRPSADPVVESTQRAAQASLEWFEGLRPLRRISRARQFAFNLLTRSRRVTYDNLRLRDPEFVAAVDAEFSPRDAAADVPAPAPALARAPQPSRRLADGHVLGSRGHPGRLSPRPPGRAGARRRRPAS